MCRPDTIHICNRMKIHMDKYTGSVKEDFRLTLPEGLSAPDIESIKSAVTASLKKRVENLQQLTSKIFLDILVLEIELYECKHSGIKRVK